MAFLFLASMFCIAFSSQSQPSHHMIQAGDAHEIYLESEGGTKDEQDGCRQRLVARLSCKPCFPLAVA